MTPDYERAALAATETLIKYSISSAPISPLPILKKIPGVLVVTYQHMADENTMDRSCVINMFGDGNHDAFTSVNLKNGKPQYLVTYNQRLSQVFVQRSLARELGHIILCHDGSRPEEVRNEEARCFANHLLTPRPLINAIRSAGFPITMECLGNLTGCYEYCLSCMRRIPVIHIPAELNRIIRDNFASYVDNFLDFWRVASETDSSAPADFGSYMEGYEE